MDDNLLADLDLSQFNESQRQTMTQNLYIRLEDKVGEQVAALVSDKQFDEFENIVGLADEAKLDEWLDRNVPNYEQITEAALNQLKQDLQTNPNSFLEAE